MKNMKSLYITPTVALCAVEEDIVRTSTPGYIEDGEGDIGYWE